MRCLEYAFIPSDEPLVTWHCRDCAWGMGRPRTRAQAEDHGTRLCHAVSTATIAEARENAANALDADRGQS